MDATDYAATQSRLRQALATHDEDYLKRELPGAWPWPVSQEAAEWMQSVDKAQKRQRFEEAIKLGTKLWDEARGIQRDEAGMPMLVEGEK